MSESSIYCRRRTCRGCGSERLRVFLELGPTPLANSFLGDLADAADEPSFPLDVVFCEECKLVQLVDVVAPEVLFRDYVYVSGTSRTMTEHFRRYALAVIERLDLGRDDLVIEVASNDGTLLANFVERGTRVLGVEPALNVAELARERGVTTLTEFFSRDTAERIRDETGMARAVVANNVLAHVDDTPDFLAGCRALLAPGGLVVIEAPYLGDLVEGLEYDTVYHEHLCYFSITPLMRMFDSVGLKIVDVERVPIHGGSLRVFGGRSDEHPDHGPAACALAESESSAGLTTFDGFAGFADRVAANRDRLVGLLESLRADGKRLAAYGAPAKGNTLLNYCGIGTDLLPFTVDKSPHKVGLLTPGMHLPVRPVEELRAEQPDYALILAWNFADEIRRQEQDYMEAGGRFLVPIPEPKELDA